MPQPNLNADELDAIEIDLAKCPRDWLALERVVVAAPSLLAQARAAEEMAEALEAIVEGNLGDAAWQANYERIRAAARDALATYLGRSV